MIGIKYIKINGVDRADEMFSCQIKETIDGASATLTNICDYTETFTIGYDEILIVNSDNVLIFAGVIMDLKENITKGVKKTTIVALDTKTNASNIAVRIRFPTETTAKTAIQTLLTAYYPGHVLGLTADILAETDCELEFNGKTYSEAMKAILALTETEINWQIDYNESTGIFTHHFYTAFQVSLGTYTKIKYGSQPFYENPKAIKNSIFLTATNMKMPERHTQRLYFESNLHYELELLGNLDVLFIPFEHAPAGDVRLNLLVGSTETPTTLLNCSRIGIGVEPADPESDLYEFDINRMMIGNPDFEPDFMKGLKNHFGITVGGTGRDIGVEVKKMLAGKFVPKFTAQHYEDSIPELDSSIHGYMACRSKIYIVNNLSFFNNAYNLNITKDEIIGYELVYPYTIDYSQLFENATSISSYRLRYKNLGNKRFNSIKMFQLYGKAKVAELSQPTTSGNFTIKYFDNGVFGILPKVGYKVGVDTGYSPWTETNVNIRAVTHNITAGDWECIISADKNPDIGMIQALLSKIENAGVVDGKASITTNVTRTDTVPITELTPTSSIHTIVDMTFDNLPAKEVIFT